MKKLYLDIDGVLITKEGKPAEGLVEFLAYATERFECYWLTTHCDGSTDGPFLYLVGKVPAEALPYIEKIRPTTFGSRKTEAIDFTSDFYWLDDTVFESEQAVLREQGKANGFIHVDLVVNPSFLLTFIKKIID